MNCDIPQNVGYYNPRTNHQPAIIDKLYPPFIPILLIYVDITHVNSSLMSTLIWISSNVEITDAKKKLVILISKSLCTEIVQ